MVCLACNVVLKKCTVQSHQISTLNFISLWPQLGKKNIRKQFCILAFLAPWCFALTDYTRIGDAGVRDNRDATYENLKNLFYFYFKKGQYTGKNLWKIWTLGLLTKPLYMYWSSELIPGLHITMKKSRTKFISVWCFSMCLRSIPCAQTFLPVHGKRTADGIRKNRGRNSPKTASQCLLSTSGIRIRKALEYVNVSWIRILTRKNKHGLPWTLLSS